MSITPQAGYKVIINFTKSSKILQHKFQFRNVTYGRIGKSKQVCSGKKNLGPPKDCLVNDFDILNQVKIPCQASQNCSLAVGGYLADLSTGCNTNIKELNVTYSCGNNF